jgi:branched-chain amino acid transport system permease protein
LSGALAAVAAILVAIAFNVVNSTMGSSYMTLAIAVLVIGGFGSVKGAFLGGLFVGLVSTLSIGYISSGFSDVIVYGTLIIFLLVRPTGIVRVADILGRA